MRVTTAPDFKRLLSMLPDEPGNLPLANELHQLIADTEVIQHPWTFEVDFATTIVQGSGNVFAAPAAGGGQSTGNFQVDTSSPFMLVSTTFSADIVGAAKTISTLPQPNVVILITDQSSGRQFMNGPVPIPSMFGTAQLPYFWPQPRLIPANSTITMQVTNYDAASVPNIRLSFQGWRFFDVSQ